MKAGENIIFRNKYITKQSYTKYLISAFLMFLLLIICGCSKSVPEESEGKVVVNYWEMWTGFELDAMKHVVNKFNESQDKIYVNLLSVSEIERKLLIAIAGKDPPDLANLQDSAIPQFADKHAIEPLSGLLGEDRIEKQDYIDIYWRLCEYKQKLYGLPIAATTIALHWNKGVFREMGLDPDNPPKTLKELDRIAKELTVERGNRNYKTLGFTPTLPGWWNYAWVWWFGGNWWDGKEITANRAENVEAFKWIRSYSKKYGVKALQNFTSGFGSFSWSDDRFMLGKLAVVLQGTWMSRFIKQMSPDMEWEAAAFPSVNGRFEDVTMAECNVLIIPRGAKHKEEAAKFIAFVQKPENLQYLASNQNKFAPLKAARKMDYSQHQNKQIELFIRLSQSKNVHSVPRIPIWQEYAHEIDNAFQSVWLGKKTPKQALDKVQDRITDRWQKYREIAKLREERQ
jgi:ABC-type glycerol-3-phosphate transport system substrate-binding protein